MIHGGRDSDTGRHFVVEQPTDFRAKRRSDATVDSVVSTFAATVDASGQVSFERFRNLFSLSSVGRDHEQRTVAKRFGLQSLGILQKLCTVDFQERVLAGETGSATGLATRDDGGLSRVRRRPRRCARRWE